MEYDLPKQPKIKIKTKQPDQRRFCVVPLRAVLSKNLTLTGLKVLCLLASYANKGGFTYVSQGKMANDLNVSIAAINHQIKQLENKGFIKQYPGYHSMIKGKTKRIIYDEALTDDDVIKISNTPKEEFNRDDIKAAYFHKNLQRKQ